MPRKGTVKQSIHRSSITEKFASPKFGKQKQKPAKKEEAGKNNQR
ncbi:MAG: hypothetical protein PHW02_05345 [bacterium]|nr:hypothetical protein [bacterium]